MIKFIQGEQRQDFLNPQRGVGELEDRVVVVKGVDVNLSASAATEYVEREDD